MTNDYPFRALLQQSNLVLKEPVRSLLHFTPKEVISAKITNPIELGTAMVDKTFILTIKVIVNNHTIRNLKTQI